jgi:hypothetical protein
MARTIAAIFTSRARRKRAIRTAAAPTRAQAMNTSSNGP